MKKLIFYLLILSALLISGCSPVQIYSDSKMTNKTGLKFYSVKPFLQVERDLTSGKIVKSVILYLPDLANPQYMAIKNGPGSSKVDIKLTEAGSLSNFGYESEIKIEEYIESLATMISKGAGAIDDLSSLKSPEALKGASSQVELYEIVINNEKTILREVTFE